MGMCVSQCVCVRVCECVDGMNLTYTLRWQIHVLVHSMLYTSTCTQRILRPFEDSEPTGLKVDTALLLRLLWPHPSTLVAQGSAVHVTPVALPG